jgi:hypothetical protein
MSKPRRELNPKLTSGDRVMCLHMDGETDVPPGTLGTVRSVTEDPFEDGGYIINMSWDNGSTLGLVSITDSWVKDAKEQIDENSNQFEFFGKNPELFENFDYRFFREYLKKVKKSGAINMFQSGAFLFSGRDWIDRYYGENREDNEEFQEVLDMADESKDKMIQGVIKFMSSKNNDFDDMSRINTLIQRFAQKIVQMYMNFY